MYTALMQNGFAYVYRRVLPTQWELVYSVEAFKQRTVLNRRNLASTGSAEHVYNYNILLYQVAKPGHGRLQQHVFFLSSQCGCFCE